MNNRLKSPGRRRYKTWTSEDQIIAAIDRKSRLAKKKAKISEQLFEEQKQLFRKAGDFLFEYEATPEDETEVRSALHNSYIENELKAKAAKEKSEKMGRHAARLVNTVLPRLKDILAAFRTNTMPGILGDYKGVAVR